MKKYEIIFNSIKNKIENGLLKENDRLPNEEEIAAEYGVSRITANKALNLLQKENLIRRVRGRGNFVSTFSYQSNMIDNTSFTEQMASLSIKQSKRLLEYSLFDAKTMPDLLKKMNVDATSQIHYIVRLLYANDIPMAISYSYITPKYFKEVNVKEVEGSLYEMLRIRGAEFNDIENEMLAVIPSQEQKELLKIDQEALLKVMTSLYDQDHDLIEYTEMFYVGSKYSYRIHLNRNGEVYGQ